MEKADFLNIVKAEMEAYDDENDIYLEMDIDDAAIQVFENHVRVKKVALVTLVKSAAASIVDEPDEDDISCLEGLREALKEAMSVLDDAMRVVKQRV